MINIRTQPPVGARSRCLWPLALFVAFVLLTGCALQAFAMLRADPRDNFDPRSDDYAEGQCP